MEWKIGMLTEMTNSPSLGRKVAAQLPVVSAVLGLTIVIGSVAFFYFDRVAMTMGAVAVGMLFLLAGTWYAANPFFKDDREYLRLPMRAEVDRFTGLLRQLNAAAVEDRTGPEFEQAKAAMHESVERMQEISMETMKTTDPQTRAI